jgi:hypothetical protein
MDNLKAAARGRHNAATARPNPCLQHSKSAMDGIGDGKLINDNGALGRLDGSRAGRSVGY